MASTFRHRVDRAREASSPRATARLLARAIAAATDDGERREALLARAAALLEAGELDDAIDDALFALAGFPIGPSEDEERDALLLVGRGFHGKRMWREAMAHLTQCLEGSPSCAAARALRG